MTSSHRVPPFPSWNSLLTLLSWILQSDIWELMEGNGEKVNILRSKLERSLLRNCIVMCECNSQNYTFLVRDHFASTVFLKSALEYFLALCSRGWQSKFPQIKNWKKLSEKLLSDVWLYLSELHHSLSEPFPRTVSVDSERCYFGWIWRVEGQRTYPPRKRGMKLSEKLFCDVSIHFTVLHHPFLG